MNKQLAKKKPLILVVEDEWMIADSCRIILEAEGYKVQVANISCGGCHSSPVFDKNGNATKAAWIGGANTSLHLDGLLAQIYQGLKIGLADQQLFMQKIREAYPLMDADEDLTIEKNSSAITNFKFPLSNISLVQDALLMLFFLT